MQRSWRHYDSGMVRGYRRASKFFSHVEELDREIMALVEEKLDKQVEEMVERLDSPELENLLEKAEEIVAEEEARYSRYSRLKRMKRIYYSDNESSDEDALAQALEEIKRNGGSNPSWFERMLEKPRALARAIVLALKVVAYAPSLALRILRLLGAGTVAYTIMDYLVPMTFERYVDIYGGHTPWWAYAAGYGFAILISIIVAGVFSGLIEAKDIKEAERLGWKLVRGEELTDVEIAFLQKYIDRVSPKLRRLLKAKKIE